jgi:hypothetical protein
MRIDSAVRKIKFADYPRPIGRRTNHIRAENASLGWPAGNVMEWILQLICTGGGIIAGMLIERWRRKWELEKEAMEKHFEEIKKCLFRLKESIYSLRHSFILDESFLLPSISSVEERLREDYEQWWRSFSLRGFECGNLLFDDLRNHYPSLYSKLISLEKFVRERYPDFLHALIPLLQRMEEDPRLKGLIERVMSHAATTAQMKIADDYRKAVIFLSLGIGWENWPNLYRSLRVEWNTIEEAGKRLYNTEEAKKVRDIREDAFRIMDSCCAEIDEVMLSKILRGKCRYVRAR